MKKESKNTKLAKNGISLIVLIITIIVIIILSTAVIVTISSNNPIDEANTARYESDRDNIQALFTNTVAKVMAKNLGNVNITATQINSITSGVNTTTGEVSYTVEGAANTENASGKIVFDKGQNIDTIFYTGKQLPIYKAGDTKWYVDSEGAISLEVGENTFGTVQKIPAGLYDENDVMIANWDVLINDYGLDVASNYTSSTYKTSANSMYSILTNNEELSTATKLIIGNDVTNIGNYAFGGCSTLTSVTMGDSEKSIGSYAFSGCNGLTSVTIGNLVTSIGNGAFWGCDGLESVIIPKSVVTISREAFRDCDGLTSVIIGDSVESIGTWTFYDCNSLKSLTIGKSLESIGYGAFYYCGALNEIKVDENNTTYHSGKNSDYFIETATNTLIRAGNSTKIPDYVTSIGAGAFSACTDLITIGSIGSGASLEIPDSVTSIGGRAFDRCSGLTSIEIPRNITSIGDFFLENTNEQLDVSFSDVFDITWEGISFEAFAGDHETDYKSFQLKKMFSTYGIGSAKNANIKTSSGATESHLVQSLEINGITREMSKEYYYTSF